MVTCQNCGSECMEVLDLGMQPICNRNLKDSKESATEERYHLGLWFCNYCDLMQQPQQLPTDIIFRPDFNYVSSSSRDVVSHYIALANRYIKEFGLGKDDFVVELGSNDGVMLKPFKENGINVLGVDPAKIAAKMANDAAIPTMAMDFADAQLIIKNTIGKKIKLLMGMDVIAHTGDINGFLEKASELISENNDAVFITQSHYLPKLIEHCEWDTAYIEHQRFYTVTALRNLFARHHMFIYDCEFNDFYGGSVIVYATYNQRSKTDRLIQTYKDEEKYCDFNTYAHFRDNVEKNKQDLLELLKKEKQIGQKLIGIGAPMKATTLLTYCGIGTDLVEYLTERNQLKVGTLQPGTHQPIISDEEFLASKDNVATTTALVLSWNMAETIIRKLKEKGAKCRFIVPIPTPKLVE